MVQIRKPAVAGQFYPGDERSLLAMLDELFSDVHKEKLWEKSYINALVAPHAGYIFSGRQAAKAYQYLNKGNYDLVCIISPSHREYFPAISVYPGDSYKTLLGLCPVHSAARDLALSCEGIVSTYEGHRVEHALEVQLPFMQYMLGDLPVLPMVMGDQSAESIEQMSACIKKLFGTFNNKILFIASSDLSHFHPANEAKEMDGQFIELLGRSDTDLILNKLEEHEVEACGGGPVLAILKGLDIAPDEIKVLGYSHSGEILNDNESVVGYTSAIMIKGNG